MTTSNVRLLARALIPALVVGMSLLTFASPSLAQRVRSDFFGMHDSEIANGSVPGVSLGAIRLWDTGTAWRQIEKLPGLYDWSAVNAAVSTARAAGLRPLLVLGQTPQFYAEDPRAPGAYGEGASSMPRLTAWRQYVSAAVTRYGTTVDYQVWNEPNIGNYWTGTVPQMALLTATASDVIAQIEPKATVVAPDFPLRRLHQRTWFRKYWAAKINGNGMASYVDVVAVHLYPLADRGPEASLKLLGFARRVLPKAARSKPVWNTEINYGLLGGSAAKPIPDAKQAAFVARTLLLNAGSGIGRMYWYAWAQGPIANTHLVQDDRTTLTRAGHAWQVTQGWIVGTNMHQCARTAAGRLKGLYTCTARESRTEIRRFFWKPSGAAVKITTRRSTKSWTDLSGHRTARKGRFLIKVGESPIEVTSHS